MDIGREKYVSFTTYRKNGDAKSTPVWIADLDGGKVGFTTLRSSWKVRRLANDPRVTLQPCDMRGTPTAGSEPLSGTAVADDAAFDTVSARIRAKYGWVYALTGIYAKVTGLFGKDVGGSDTAVVVTLD